jgi:threonyl-tRNA synthetase
MPQRFELEYTAADGEKKRPVMIHRAILGSMERFIGILIEHYAGFLPLWLSPVQAVVMPISEKVIDYSKTVYEQLCAAHIRAEHDDRAEKIGYKIREAETHKIPYMVIIGEKEMNERKVSARQHTRGEIGTFALPQFISLLHDEITNKTIQG